MSKQRTDYFDISAGQEAQDRRGIVHERKNEALDRGAFAFQLIS